MGEDLLVLAAVSAVVVLFEPDPALLRAQYDAVHPQVGRVVYVDNGGGRQALTATGILGEADAELIGAGENVGLGGALNDALRLLGAGDDVEYALLLDQDSVPEPSMVATLRRGFDAAGTPAPVAAVGPAIVDLLRGRVEYFVRLGLPRNRRIRSTADAGAEFFEVDFLITSGSLLDLRALEKIGLMDADLFIDSIDFDWSFRARDRGFALLATFAAQLGHRRGDEIVRGPGGLRIRTHSATRLYYMHRNRVRLYSRRHVPLAWKVHDVGRVVVKAALLMAFAPRRRSTAAAIVRGTRDGLRQRGGRAD